MEIFGQTNNYAFTLIIPGGCDFGKKGAQRYREYSNIEQERMLNDLIVMSFEELYHRDISFDIFFEKHKDQRSHCHGTINNTTALEMSSLQRLINIHLGYSIKNDKLFHYKREFNAPKWDKYKTKDQPNPLFKNLEKPQRSPLFDIPLPGDNNIDN